MTAATATKRIQLRAITGKHLNQLPILVHYTKASKIVPRLTPYHQSITSKPQGFWVSAGDSWLRWSQSENFHIGGLTQNSTCKEAGVNIFITLFKSDARILWINSLSRLDTFNKKYQDRHFQFQWQKEADDINWKNVAKRYDGILIAPYQYKRRHKFHWYYGWDCASGCIWNWDSISGCEQIDERDVPKEIKAR